MTTIKPIILRNSRLLFGNESSYIVHNNVNVFPMKNREVSKEKVKNFRYRYIKVNESSRSLLLKSFLSRKAFSVDVEFSNYWQTRHKIFKHLTHNLRKLTALRSLKIKLDSCLALNTISFLLNKLKSLRNLEQLTIDLTRFYLLTPYFVKKLSELVHSSTKLKFLCIKLQKTPEASFSDELLPLFRAVKQLTNLESFSYLHAETIQVKRYIQIKPVQKVFDLLGELKVDNITLNLKSNTLISDFLNENLRPITSNQNLKGLSFTIENVDNLLTTTHTNFLLKELTKNRNLKQLAIKNSLKNLIDKETDELCSLLPTFLSSHPNLNNVRVNLHTLFYGQGLRISSLLFSLKNLQSLTMKIRNQKDVILLNELNHAKNLRELDIGLSFPVKDEVSSFLESIGRLTDLEVLKVRFLKQRDSEVLTILESFTLFENIKKLKNLRELQLESKRAQSTKSYIGFLDIQFLLEFLKNARCLNKCLMPNYNLQNANTQDLRMLVDGLVYKIREQDNFSFQIGTSIQVQGSLSNMDREIQAKLQKAKEETGHNFRIDFRLYLTNIF